MDMGGNIDVLDDDPAERPDGAAHASERVG
jgi:hypothetical protein